MIADMFCILGSVKVVTILGRDTAVVITIVLGLYEKIGSIMRKKIGKTLTLCNTILTLVVH
jgi:hypothetical protein